MPSLLDSSAIVLLAYLLGSIPTAYIIGRCLRGIDIRSVGSGNSGAMNAGRQLGKIAGVIVLAIDTSKGAVAILIGQQFGVPVITLYIAALAAALGHNFSPFLKFRGGKGAATVLGISMLMLWQLTTISIVLGVIVIALTRHVVWSMTVIFVALNVLTIATGQPLGQIMLCILLSLLVAGTHFVRQRSQLIPALMDRDWRRFMKVE